MIHQRLGGFLVVLLLGVLYFSPLAFCNVLHLTDKTFGPTVVEGEVPSLVMFHAPWCGHCKRAVPHVEKVAEDLASKKYPVNMVMVDATSERELAERYGITSFPQFYWFTPGDEDGSDTKLVNRNYNNLLGLIEGQTGILFEAVAESRLRVLEQDELEHVKDIIQGSNRTTIALYGNSKCAGCGVFRRLLDQFSAQYAGDSSVEFLYVNDHAIFRRPSSKWCNVSFTPVVHTYPSKLKGNDEGYYVRYGARSQNVEDVAQFIRETTDTFVRDTESGRLDGDAGTVPELSELAKQASTGDNVLEEMTQQADVLRQQSSHQGLYVRAVDYYVHVADKLSNGDEEFVQRELSRLSSVLEGDLSQGAHDWATIRTNVLRVFS